MYKLLPHLCVEGIERIVVWIKHTPRSLPEALVAQVAFPQPGSLPEGSGHHQTGCPQAAGTKVFRVDKAAAICSTAISGHFAAPRSPCAAWNQQGETKTLKGHLLAGPAICNADSCVGHGHGAVSTQSAPMLAPQPTTSPLESASSNDVRPLRPAHCQGAQSWSQCQ